MVIQSPWPLLGTSSQARKDRFVTSHQCLNPGFKVHVSCMVFFLKVTVHVGTDQNIEIALFAEYKYTLDELLVKKIFFSTSNSLRDMTNESFYRK